MFNQALIKKQGFKKLATVLFVLSQSPLLLAQDGEFFDQFDSAIENEQINIDGNYANKRSLSPEELLESAQEDAERKNAEQIANRIKQLKVPEKQIKGIEKNQANILSQKIGNVFSGEAVDTVNTKQSAKSKSVEKIDNDFSDLNAIKIIPKVGATSFQNGSNSLESKFDVGLSIESMVSERFSVGLGLVYSVMEITDYANNNAIYNYNNSAYNSYSGYSYNPYSNYGYQQQMPYYYSTGYTQQYGTNGRTIDYTRYSFEINSKYFLTVSTRVRPYLGLGVTYSRAQLKYTDSGSTYSLYSPIYNNQATYGNESVTGNYFSGAASIGTDVQITKNFGFNMDLKYQRALSMSSNSTARNEDQLKLDAVSEVIENSHMISLYGGILFSF